MDTQHFQLLIIGSGTSAPIHLHGIGTDEGCTSAQQRYARPAEQLLHAAAQLGGHAVQSTAHPVEIDLRFWQRLAYNAQAVCLVA